MHRLLVPNKNNYKDIAYRMLTAKPNSDSVGSSRFEYSFTFKSSKEKKTAISLMVVALKQVLNINTYNQLDTDERKKVEHRVFFGLRYSNSTIMIKENKRLRCDWLGQYKADHISLKLECKEFSNQAKVVADLKNLLREYIGQCRTDILLKPNSEAITFLCINRYHKNSTPGTLPHDVARMIARKTLTS